jgi:dTDP-4-dehydrorhamnose 3,5-epimerase-like enzyme
MQEFSASTSSGSSLAGTITLPSSDESRGLLLPFDLGSLPFVPARIFVVKDVPVGTVRGGHAHREQQQLLFCLSGSLEVVLERGGESALVVLDSPATGLLIEPGTWSSQKFLEADSIELVFASGPYDPLEYIVEKQ